MRVQYIWILALLVAELGTSTHFKKIDGYPTRISHRALEVIRRYWKGDACSDDENTVGRAGEETTTTSAPPRGNIFKHYWIRPTPRNPRNEPTPTPPDECEIEREIETTVTFSLIDVPYDSFSVEQIHETLEKAFLKAYAMVAKCGNQKLEDTNIESDMSECRGSGRKYLVSVSGKCRGCPNNVRVIGDDTVGRRLVHNFLRALEDDPCVCPPPSKEEFLEAYN